MQHMGHILHKKALNNNISLTISVAIKDSEDKIQRNAIDKQIINSRP